MKPFVRLLLADDHPVFRMGLRTLLEETGRLEVVAEADDGEAALTLIEAKQPDIAIVDFDMPKMNGVEVAAQVRSRRLHTKIVLLTGHKNESLVNKVLDAGPLGFVLKDGAATDIVDCVDAVHAGKHYISPQLSSVLIARRAGAAALESEHAGLAALTPAEKRVLRLIAQGKTSKEIGEELFISARTVEFHRAAISEKLNLRGSNALVKFAAANRSFLT